MRPYPDNAYPDAFLSDGGPLATLFRGLQARLKELFDPALYTHITVPPRASAKDWDNLTRRMPVVGLGWMGLSPSERCGGLFRGNARFALMLLTRQNFGESAYFGDERLPGLLGLAAIPTLGLHGWTVEPFGACRLTQVVPAGEQEWIPEGVASVQCEIVVPDVSFDAPALLAQLDRLKTVIVNEGNKP